MLDPSRRGGLLRQNEAHGTAVHVELGMDTSGDMTADSDGRLLPHAQVIRNVIREGVVADAAGVDFFGVGEHHRADFAVSAPEVVLAAIAGQTRCIRLGSAVTVLSSDDPIRVFQRFASLDAASNGRAEVIFGRGSFTKSFPLFGYELSQYETLFDRIGAERGGPLMGRAEFDREADRSSPYVGSPEAVARKIAATVQALSLSLFDMKYSAGSLAHEKLLPCIELYGRKVIPLVREMLAS